jgi:VWFA-related protein
VRRAAWTLAFWLPSAAVWPQEKPESPRFATGTELIELEVVVTTKDGAPVHDLMQQDFVVLEEGRPRPIRSFARRATKRVAAEVKPGPGAAPAPPIEISPRQILIVVDNAGIRAESLLGAKQALLRVLDERLEPDDVVAMVTTEGSPGLIQEVTSDRALLRRAVERIGIARPVIEETPLLTTYQADLIRRGDVAAREDYIAELLREDPLLLRQAAIALMEARAVRVTTFAAAKARTLLSTLQSLLEAMGSLPGRKMLVLLSDGFFLTGEEQSNLQPVTAAATRAGVVICALDTQGRVARSPIGDATVIGTRAGARMGPTVFFDSREADRKGMNALSRDTGGFPVFESGDLAGGLGRIVDDGAFSYRLAYEPAESASEKYRKIEVKIPARSGLRVRTHRGYIARPPAPTPDDDRAAEKAMLRAALRSPLPRHDFAVHLAVGQLQAADPTFVIDIHVPGLRERLCPKDVEGACPVEILGAIYDTAGRPLSTFEDRRALPRGADSVSFQTRSPVEPGAYGIRAAAAVGRNVATVFRWVEMPDVKAGVFALSDLFVSPDGESWRNAEDGRRLSADSPLEFVLYAYNAKSDPEVLSDVVFETRVLAGEKVVAEETPFALVVAVGEPTQPHVVFRRRLNLKALGAGEYTLAVRATDRISKATAERRARLHVAAPTPAEPAAR